MVIPLEVLHTLKLGLPVMDPDELVKNQIWFMLYPTREIVGDEHGVQGRFDQHIGM